MANRRSTIEFISVVEPILKKLEISGFDIRAVVNGAIVAFDKLSGDEQKNAIAEANQAPGQPEKTSDIKDIVQNLSHCVKYQILSVEDQKEVEKLRKLLGPEKTKKKRKTS